MTIGHRVLMTSMAGLLGGMLAGTTVLADDVPTDIRSELERLKDILAEQDAQIEQQARQIEQLLQRRTDEADALSQQQLTLEAQQLELEKQRDQIEAQRREIESLQRLADESQGTPGAPQQAALRPGLKEPSEQLRLTVADEEGAQPPDQAPEGDFVARPEISAIPEQGGVLTSPGDLQIEPAIVYTQSNLNRFTFRGVELIEAFLVGVIEASDADRDTIVAQLTGRYGFSNRLEIETTVPAVYRDDRQSIALDPSGTFPVTDTRSTTGFGLGDVEAAAHFQMNSGRDGWPFFVANIRAKTTTGEGPFDVNRNESGVPTELATGSGFYTFSPSITAIFPTDPAVFFGNVGYTWAVEDEEVDEQIGNTIVRSVDPGDSVDISFGVAVSLNPRASFTLGYTHQFVDGTQQVIELVAGIPQTQQEFKTDTLDIGSLLVAGSYRVGDRTRVNLNVKAGITADAPDVTLELRIPTTFDIGVI